MRRRRAPFHGADGEGKSAISPATSQAGAEPCARAFSAARAKRNAPVINDNAVVAAPMNWRAESTGSSSPSTPGDTLAENHGKSRSAIRISAVLRPGTGTQTGARRLRVPPAAAPRQTVTIRLADDRDHLLFRETRFAHCSPPNREPVSHAIRGPKSFRQVTPKCYDQPRQTRSVCQIR